MPRPLFAIFDHPDVALFTDWLNRDEEIAIIVSDGRGRWKAVPTVASLQDGSHTLWHVPGGRLPIGFADPWVGWQETRAGDDPTRPYFGAGWPCTFDVGLGVRYVPYIYKPHVYQPALGKSVPNPNPATWVHEKTVRPPNAIGRSAISWIGKHYQHLGGDMVVQPSTEAFWKRLKKFLDKHGRKLPQKAGPVWAFPAASAAYERWSREGDRVAYEAMRDKPRRKKASP